MSLQFDGNGQVDIPGFTLRPTDAWSVTINVTYEGKEGFVMGNVTESGPYLGFFGGGISFRCGAATTLPATLVSGQSYAITVSNDGNGNVTLSVPGVGTQNGTTNATCVFNVFGRYQNVGFNNKFVYDGIISGLCDITGVPEGDLSYNFESPQDSPTLFELNQSADGTLANFTTGGFGEPAASDASPVITILGNNPETITVGDIYTDAGATASDAEDGDLTGSIQTVNNVDESTEGSYTVDYSVTDSGGNTTVASRTVNVELAAGTPVITIESLVEGQSKLQDVNEQADFTLAGSIVDGTGPVEYQLDDGAWQVLDASTGTTFTGTITVTGQQDVSVRLQNSPDSIDTVRYITAVEMVIGISPAQSNGAGRGLNLQQPAWGPTKPRPTMYKYNEGFFLLDDPTSNDIDPAQGSMWPHYAKLLADRGIRVCIGNVASGGTRIAQHLPGTLLYTKLQQFASQAGGLTHTIGVIGESDILSNTDKAAFKADYLTILQDINTNLGATPYVARIPASPGVIDEPNYQNIIDAMDELVAENAFVGEGGNLGEIDLTGNQQFTGGSLHLVTDEQLEQGARIIYTAVEGIDAIAPTITLTGMESVSVNEGESYTDAGATASDNIDGDITANIVVDNPVNTSVPGVYTVRYNVVDSAGNAATEVTREVTVVAINDTVKPVITLNGSASVTITEGDTYIDAGATASDNVDGDLTGSIVVSGTVNTTMTGVYTLRYNVTDAAGNAADEVTRTVTVQAAPDTTAPVITLTGSASVTITQGSTFTDPGATASDDTDGDLSANIVVTGSVDTGVIGVYTLSYNVSDAAGNAAQTVTRTVNVVAAPSAGSYDFNIPGVTAFLYLSGCSDNISWKEVKDPSDEVYYDIEVEKTWLASESIVSVTLDVDQASGLSIASPGVSENFIRTFVTGGTPGDHDVEVTITTETRKAQRTLKLSVAER